MYIDSHCHLDFEEFDSDREQVMATAARHHVNHFIVPGITVQQWQRLVQMQARYPTWHIGFGLHPYFIKKHRPQDVEQLRHYLDECQQAIAVGEIGLDKRLPDYPKQLELFELQLQVAREYQKPVIIHCVKAHNDMIRLLKKYPQLNGVIHAFSGSQQMAMDFIDMGFYLGVGGVITYQRAQKTRRTLTQVPIESLLLETDAPDMPLSYEKSLSYKSASDGDKQRNEPVNVVTVLDELAELRQQSKQSLRQQIFLNTLKLFNLKIKNLY